MVEGRANVKVVMRSRVARVAVESLEEKMNAQKARSGVSKEETVQSLTRARVKRASVDVMGPMEEGTAVKAKATSATADAEPRPMGGWYPGCQFRQEVLVQRPDFGNAQSEALTVTLLCLSQLHLRLVPWT